MKLELNTKARDDGALEEWDDALDAFETQLQYAIDELGESERVALFEGLRARYCFTCGAHVDDCRC